jgi:TonB family protein
MRKELELMETIDNYLNGRLSEAERAAFENRMNADPNLKKEVELQKQLLEGMERAGLKQSAKQSMKKYKLGKGLKKWGLMGLSVAVIALGSMFVYNSISKNEHKENDAYELPELNEQGEKLWSDADKYLAPQLFELDTEKDTVVETQDGIVIAVPAHSFLAASGQSATGRITLEVKEALHAGEIMKAGLSTKSGDKLLETGGMFYINARQEGASLKIDPKNPLYAEIPAAEIKPNMQLFEGKRMPDGSIDWVNPKPIRKDLIPVDLTSLDFYPPHYLDSVKAFGYNNKDKRFTDSLYFSYASLFGKSTVPLYDTISDDFDEPAAKPDSAKNNSLTAQLGIAPSGERLFKQNCVACHSLGKNTIIGPGLKGVLTRVPGEDWLLKYIKNNEALIKSGDAYAQKIQHFSPSAMTVFTNLSDDEIKNIIAYIKNYSPVTMSNKYGAESIKGINPASVRAIWDGDFDNTLIATREFGNRMPLIHNTCDQNVLDTYVNNLDKDLSAIDSAVMLKHPEFAAFAARGDGKVNNSSKTVQLLEKYYEERKKQFTETMIKTRDAFRAKVEAGDANAAARRTAYSQKEIERMNNNFKEELFVNINTASGQIRNNAVLPATTYGAPITSTGWKNCDRFIVAVAAIPVGNATKSRTSLSYTVPGENTPRVSINYRPLSVSVKARETFDRVLVYLLPDELNSFMRAEEKNGNFDEKLNELMICKMVCIGYKGKDSYYYSQDNVKPGSLAVALIKTDDAIIQDNINKLGKLSQVKAMNDELNYFAFEKEESRRQAMLVKLRELTEKIRKVIFPCMPENIEAPAVAPERNPAAGQENSGVIQPVISAPLTIVEQMPGFPGGDAAMAKFINKNIGYPQKEKEDGIQGTCYITFIVEPDGSLSNIQVLRGIPGGASLDAEALRVVKSMPRFTPGKQSGKVVRVQYNLPIKFRLK